ncbi:MAG: GNAT family N-acetyltransferase [Peptococcaceae bacterium]|nr:GNAT family N-acetyltransferase [Peptococcaceae bacterium]
MHIRPITAKDVEPAISVLQEQGWDNRQQFEFYFNHPSCHPFVAVVDGKVVGTAVGTRNGNVGWLGNIFVSLKFRRYGIGTALTSTLIEHLEKLGCRTLLLIATDLGRSIYERLRFTAVTCYHVFEGPALANLPRHPLLRPLTADDLPRVCELDRWVTGEDRSDLLRAFSDKGWVVTSENGSICGFYISTPWGRGPIVATDPDAGKTLLDLRRARDGGPDTVVKHAMTTENAVGRKYLARSGFKEINRLTRMIRGEPLHWHPAAIWGQFNFALG